MTGDQTNGWFLCGSCVGIFTIFWLIMFGPNRLSAILGILTIWLFIKAIRSIPVR